MGDIVNLNQNLPAAIADLFDEDQLAGDLTEGVSSGFPIVSIRGSKWRIKYQGEETPVLNDEDEPAASLEVIMLKANKNLSKIYYKANYVEGETEAPDCYSNDGIKPEVDSKDRQADTCQMCPHNQWGSRITDAGKKAKACHDSRRVAVVPSKDILNEVYGGPMLLRIPAASLADLALFSKQLMSKQIPYNAIVTRLGFDINAAYPKLTFKAVRKVTNDDAVLMREVFDSGNVDSILALNEFNAPAKEAPAAYVEEVETPSAAVNTDFEEEPPEKAAPRKKAAAKKAAPKKKAAVREKAEEKKVSNASSIDDELDNILEGLDNLQ